MTQLLTTFIGTPALAAEFFGNTIAAYIAAVLWLVAWLIIFKIVQAVILMRLERLAKRTKTDMDDIFIAIVHSIRPPFYFFLAFYLAVRAVAIPLFVLRVINAVLIIWIVYQVIIALQMLVDYAVRRRTDREKGKIPPDALSLMSKITKGVLWFLGVLMVLSNLGVNVSSLIAGLGIGGIAIALAVQNILSDLFSSFAIYFDKPFVAGDFIIVGDKMGVVERIGIKTTRIKSLQGEEIVISNKDLTGTIIQNFKKMKERRIVFSFGVTYGTPVEKLQKIPGMVQNIIGGIKILRFDRAHFKAFGDSSLDFEVVYYVNAPEYNAYMDANQKVHLKIKQQFEKEGIEMAFPTRTVYVVKE